MSQLTKYHPGVEVDVDKMADGLLEIIRKDPDGRCLALGMFPSRVMGAFDAGLAERIPDEFFLKGDPLNGCETGREIRREITKDVCASVLRKAKECVV